MRVWRCLEVFGMISCGMVDEGWPMREEGRGMRDGWMMVLWVFRGFGNFGEVR